MKIIKHWQINKGDTSKWKIIPCVWNVRNNAGKVVMLSKAIYKFNVIPPKILMVFFTDIEKHSWSSYGATRGSEEPKQHWGKQIQGYNSLPQTYTSKHNMALPSKPTTNETKQEAREKTASHSVECGGASRFSQLISNTVSGFYTVDKSSISTKCFLIFIRKRLTVTIYKIIHSISHQMQNSTQNVSSLRTKKWNYEFAKVKQRWNSLTCI